jgi:glycosyltransferase involved in cell wall biosynthesis
MRITFIIPSMNLSGGLRVVAIYAAALKDLGHTVNIITPDSYPYTAIEKLKEFIKTRQWAKKEHLTNQYFNDMGLSVSVLIGHRCVDESFVPDADIIIATWWETAEWVHKYNSSKGKKVYLIQHYETFDNLPIDRVKNTYKTPLKKIVVASWLRDLMREEYGDQDVKLIYNGVDLKQFFAEKRSKQKTPTIGFLYHRTKFKGLDITLAIIKRLRNIYANLRVFSFGSQIPDKSYPLPEGTNFYHRPRQDFIRNIYAQCDVWITASRSEGFNLPALEAMACRVPIVSTRTGWPAEAVVDGVNGYLSDVDDIDSLTNSAARVLDLDFISWELMSNNAYETALKMNWDFSIFEFNKALSELVAGK